MFARRLGEVYSCCLVDSSSLAPTKHPSFMETQWCSIIPSHNWNRATVSCIQLENAVEPQWLSISHVVRPIRRELVFALPN